LHLPYCIYRSALGETLGRVFPLSATLTENFTALRFAAKYSTQENIMNILDRLHQIIERDVAQLFNQAKQTSIKAAQEAADLEAQLVAAHRRAADAAEQARVHAEAAAERARAAIRELEIEAKSAAERARLHSACIEPKEPT
jgi:F0F1-type ATP synthase membrane subunit b/b'